MRKWLGLVAILAVVGYVALPAEAVVDVIGGFNEGHIKDLSNFYVFDDEEGIPVPPDAPPIPGAELRSVLRVDDLELIGSGKYWFNTVTTGDEITGLFYDIELTYVDPFTGALYFSPLGRNPLVLGDDVDGDIVALYGAAWGGVIELYQDPSPDLDANLNPPTSDGPGLWSEAGGPFSRLSGSQADGYPNADDGTLWLSGALLDLTLFGGVPGYADPGLYVYKLTPLTPTSYSGLGYMHVFDGYAAPMIDLKAVPKVGPGAFLADVVIQNTVSLGENVWDNPNWQAGSSDPVRFDVQVIPEPTIMLLFGASIVGGLIRRRF